MTDDRSRLRWRRAQLAAAALAVAALIAGSVLTYAWVAGASKDHWNQQAAPPHHRSHPIGRVGHSTTIQTALDATPPGGTLTLAQRRIYIVTAPLRVPPRITVNGHNSTLKTPANSTTLRSEDAMMQLSNGDVVRNFIFDGNVHHQHGVWTQHRHAISIGAAHGIRIDHNTFRRLIGDGIYSSGASSLTIDHNRFNGDHSNRNGISIISGSDVWIHHNTFSSIARPDMPGAIDVEPNLPSETVNGIHVDNNTINDPAEFGMLVQDSSHASVSHVTFRNNTINGGRAVTPGGAGILIAYAPATVRGNYINNCRGYDAIRWYYAPGGSATGNHLKGAESGIRRFHSPEVRVAGNTHQ
jgi:hypothetical protein